MLLTSKPTSPSSSSSAHLTSSSSAAAALPTASAASAAKTSKPKGSAKSSATNYSDTIGRHVEIINGAPYFLAALTCLKTPYRASTGKDAKATEADKSAQFLKKERHIKRQVRVPFELTQKTLSTTLNDFTHGNIALVTPEFIREKLNSLLDEACKKVGTGHYQTVIDGKAIDGGDPKGTAFQHIRMDQFTTAVNLHRRSRSSTPDWRTQDVIVLGDTAIGRSTDHFAGAKASAATGKGPQKDVKSQKSGIDLGAEAPKDASTLGGRAEFLLGTRMISSSGYLKPDFFRHIANEDGAAGKAGTGHVRVSHDTNAFPRTWSLEKIGRFAAQAFAVASSHPSQINDYVSWHKPFCARVEGLDIFTVVTDCAFSKSAGSEGASAKKKEQGPSLVKKKGVVISAFVSRTTSSREREIRDLRAAVKKMNQLTSEKAIELFSRTNRKSIWDVLSTATVLCKLKDRLGLDGKEKQIVDEIQALLSIGETRHKIHQQLIDDRTKAILTEVDGAEKAGASKAAGTQLKQAH